MADGDSLLGYDPSQDLYGGLLNPTQRNNAGLQQIIATLGAMGAAGQPSRLPVPLGVAAGHGALAGQEAGNRAAQLYGQMNLLAPEITLKRLQALQMQQGYDYLQNYLNQQGQGQQQGQNQPPQQPASIPGQQLPAALTPPQGAHLLPLISRLENSKDDEVSNKGAVGRYQITPDTARTYGFDPAQLKDPAYNERAASAIVDNLSRRYNGDIDPILVAYNAGPGVADKWLANGRDNSALPKETQNYLARAPQLASQPLRVASNGPLSAGAGYAPSAGMPGIPNDPVAASLLARTLGPTFGKIAEKNFPGPTDFARAVQDYQSSIGTPYEQAARQRLAVATGDRYDFSRQGWAVDRVNGHIFHLPEMGKGVTGSVGPNGEVTAGVVPGAPEAEKTMSVAGTAGPRATKGYEYYLETGQLPPGGGEGGAPSGPNLAPIVQPPQASGGKFSITTANGKTDLTPTPLDNSADYLKERIPQWAKQENAWAESLPSNLIAEQRGLAIADALKKTQSGHWAEEKANVVASLKVAGIDLGPDTNLGDPAQVQRALKDNFAQTLSQIRAFTSRPAAAEVLLGQKNFSNPNLQPEANLSILSETVGQMRWERALMNDWAAAKAQGMRDPQDFQRQWTQQHPLQSFIDATKKEIGPLKGMAPQISAEDAKAELKRRGLIQ